MFSKTEHLILFWIVIEFISDPCSPMSVLQDPDIFDYTGSGAPIEDIEVVESVSRYYVNIKKEVNGKEVIVNYGKEILIVVYYVCFLG